MEVMDIASKPRREALLNVQLDSRSFCETLNWVPGQGDEAAMVMGRNETHNKDQIIADVVRQRKTSYRERGWRG